MRRRPRPPLALAFALAFGLALALAPALALAQEAPAAPASLLVYRPWPESGGDPLATALAPPPFDAARLPATRVDRGAAASPAPENAPESAPAHYREMLRLVQQAEAGGASVGLVVDGSVRPAALTLDVELVGTPASVVDLALVVFEHGVSVAGRAEPYVARFALAPERADAPGNSSRDVALDPAWELDRLGVVVLALDDDGAVLNSATWLPRQAEPTRQLEKAALVEHVTASWCAPCRPADDALALLATQRGAAGPLPSEAAGYLRAPTAWLYAGLGLGALAAVALVGRRRA